MNVQILMKPCVEEAVKDGSSSSLWISYIRFEFKVRPSSCFDCGLPGMGWPHLARGLGWALSLLSFCLFTTLFIGGRGGGGGLSKKWYNVIHLFFVLFFYCLFCHSPIGLHADALGVCWYLWRPMERVGRMRRIDRNRSTLPRLAFAFD